MTDKEHVTKVIKRMLDQRADWKTRGDYCVYHEASGLEIRTWGLNAHVSNPVTMRFRWRDALHIRWKVSKLRAWHRKQAKNVVPDAIQSVCKLNFESKKPDIRGTAIGQQMLAQQQQILAQTNAKVSATLSALAGLGK